ncbi:hypothetical protein [Sphingobacterium rhinopitheci]|uniref:hypothetical protein n=1 Tax=Sphingobacterium rhinopitheci TaxID=2781960 RepID=UPI001F51F3B3|nr:hypothetical protein [Sphingobacterium rhinopitheci]MCI0920393.1 hypothetical protein [Sphingobacterium rhinopitheci]
MKTGIHLFKKAHRKAAALICFSIFMIKMLISATPMFIDVLDKGTVLQVVMQWEIELGSTTNNNNEDLHEHGVKIFKPDAMDFLSYGSVYEDLVKLKRYAKNDKLIQSFHPEVPTPPPNC